MAQKQTILLSSLAALLIAGAGSYTYLQSKPAPANTAPADALPIRASDSSDALTPDMQYLDWSVANLPEQAGQYIIPPPETTPAIAATTAAPAAIKVAVASQLDTSAKSVAALRTLAEHPTIAFQTASSVIDAASYAYLDQLVDLLKQLPDQRLSIGGHTDNQDRLGKNQSLSDSRANAVKRYLEQKGIAAARMTAQGFGGSQPIVSNDTAAGRAQNRRISLTLL
jgi:outer membrane protein OmpA-like peptidoglycan-associated protein